MAPSGVLLAILISVLAGTFLYIAISSSSFLKCPNNLSIANVKNTIQHPNAFSDTPITLFSELMQHSAALLNQPEACASEQPIKLIIVVHTRPNSNNRKIIRETWGKRAKEKYNIPVLFVVGRSTTPEGQHKVLDDSFKFQDILQFDFEDAYHRLTSKAVALTLWLSKYCNQAQFVLKTDDDVFVNIDNIMQFLNQTSITKRSIIGHLKIDDMPIRDKSYVPKWYVSRLAYPYDIYPPYVPGCGYLMTGDVPTLLAQQIKYHVPAFHVDDVYITGILPRGARVDVVDDSGFGWPPKGDVKVSFQLSEKVILQMFKDSIKDLKT